MHYLGGKELIAKYIVDFLELQRKPGQLYIEPFIGGASIFCRMKPKKIGGDIHRDLIMLYHALQDGWIPPKTVTREQHKELRNAEPSPLRAFVGFGCSFAGKFFGGYAQDDGNRRYAYNAHNSLLKKTKGLNGDIYFGDYEQFSKAENALIYCDPPYNNRHGYKHPFNHQKFYKWCFEMKRKGNTVLISEYEMPSVFKCIYELPKRTGVRNKENKQEMRTEKIFIPCY